ncbi:MAG: GNAT family N-acetyltransferase [Rubrivivax sp.]|nr:GNAT family N-acetyltransferase [Rubrivivax sp.]
MTPEPDHSLPPLPPPAEPIDATDIVFVTPRLVARHLGAQDLDALVAVYGDADAMRWVGDGRPLARADCARWIEVTHENYRRRGYGMFALVERLTPSHAGPSSTPAATGLGAVVGFCGLVHPGGQAQPELKYALLRPHWGRGLASEAAAGLVAHGLRVLGLTGIMATVAPEHGASQRVLAKAGLRPGELRHNDDGSRTMVFTWQRGAAPPPADERIVEREPAHDEELVHLWRASFEHGVRTVDTNPIENQLAFFRRELVPHHRVRVVLREPPAARGHLAGSAAGPCIVAVMATTPDRVAQLYVRVGDIGLGIGARLLALAKAESAGSLWLYAFARNIAARRFYERHGFREAERESPGQNMYRLEAIKYHWRRGG